MPDFTPLSPEQFAQWMPYFGGNTAAKKALLAHDKALREELAAVERLKPYTSYVHLATCAMSSYAAEPSTGCTCGLRAALAGEATT